MLAHLKIVFTQHGDDDTGLGFPATLSYLMLTGSRVLEVFPSVATTPMLDAGQWTSLRCFFHNQRLSFSLDLRKIKMDQVHMSDLFMDQGDRDDQEDWGGRDDP